MVAISQVYIEPSLKAGDAHKFIDDATDLAGGNLTLHSGTLRNVLVGKFISLFVCTWLSDKGNCILGLNNI